MSSETPSPLDAYITQEELLERPQKNAVAVDPRNPVEIDDALHVERIGSRSESEVRVSIFIADAGLLSGHTELIDAAREQGWSEYGARKPKTILPKAVYKDALGLNARIDAGAPAVEVGFDFSFEKMSLGNVGITKARVNTELLTYKQHDERIGAKDGLDECERSRLLRGVARRLFASPDRLNKIWDRRQSEDVVAYFMITANRLVADAMQAKDIPWLFRNHTTDVFMSWRDDRERRVLERIKPGSYGRRPLGHDGLRIDKYCHFTSPLRRFPDLANHLNLQAYIDGTDPPYDDAEIDEIASEMTTLYIQRHPSNFRQAA